MLNSSIPQKRNAHNARNAEHRWKSCVFSYCEPSTSFAHVHSQIHSPAQKEARRKMVSDEVLENIKAACIGVSRVGSWPRRSPHPTTPGVENIVTVVRIRSVLWRNLLIFCCIRWGRFRLTSPNYDVFPDYGLIKRQTWFSVFHLGISRYHGNLDLTYVFEQCFCLRVGSCHECKYYQRSWRKTWVCNFEEKD